MPRVLLPLTDGFEDLEAVSVIDILRRAGIEVVTAGMMGNIVRSKHGVKFQTDERLIDLENFDKFDSLILVSCEETVETLARNQRLVRVIDGFAKKGKLLGAICAAPMILAKQGLLKDKKAAIHPGLEKNLDKPRGDKVVVDGNIITSQGPGTATAFALKIVELLAGRQKAEAIRQHMLL